MRRFVPVPAAIEQGNQNAAETDGDDRGLNHHARIKRQPADDPPQNDAQHGFTGQGSPVMTEQIFQDKPSQKSAHGKETENKRQKHKGKSERNQRNADNGKRQ